MEVEEIHNNKNPARCSSLSRMVTGMSASRILKRRGQHQREDDDDDDDDDGGGRVEVRTNGGGRDFENNGVDNNDNNNSSSSDKNHQQQQQQGWHNASRIIRVSRVSGGKDRHSKVLTSRGLRDRRIRLSVTTAIRFYDLQDRLGYDQPSKAVEWLIKAAADPIADLPTLNNSFPATPNTQETDLDGSFQQQQLSTLSKSSAATPAAAAALCTCSSTSDTSKGSGLSLSRTDVRVNRGKAREQERASKDNHSKFNNNNNSVAVSPNTHNDDNRNNDSNASFTELLAGAASAVHHFDCFSSGLLLQPRPNNSSGIFGQVQLGKSFPFNVGGGGVQQSELPRFSVVPDNLNPASSTQSQGGSGSGDSHRNFTVSPGSCGRGRGLSVGFNRGTLQSNLPSVLPPHMTQRFATEGEPSNFPFFVGGATATPVEGHTHTRHHHPFSSGLDSRLLFCYGDAARLNSDQKGKGSH